MNDRSSCINAANERRPLHVATTWTVREDLSGGYTVCCDGEAVHHLDDRSEALTLAAEMQLAEHRAWSYARCEQDPERRFGMVVR